MKSNLHSIDRIVRLIIGIIAVVVYFTDTLTGTAGTVFLVVGLILAATSFINFCPIYYMLGIRTNAPKKQVS